MKSIRSFTLLHLAMGALAAICLNSGLADAQTISGRFTLPFEVSWGQATLPAGDYSFAVEGIGREAKVRVYRGADSVAYLINYGFETKPSQAVALTVVRSSAGNFVRDLSLPEIGQVFHYAAPKAAPESARGKPEVARIPVTSGTK
jgi:hypothetical protein